jgi:hypothetical protein
VRETISTRTAWRKRMIPQLRHAATASWQKGRQRTPPTAVVTGMQRRRCGRRHRDQPKQQEECSLPILQHPKVSPCSSIETMENILKVISVVQQMTELFGAVSEEAKIVVITKIVQKPMKENGN